MLLGVDGVSAALVLLGGTCPGTGGLFKDVATT